ncbi:hypothetical protein U9M48_035379 [Paspalum notatum var. saurae]|uniref:Response regulatory domain-containing protein n=1 Tax=Paspalum notatum var. saurae TaxID=547442 RepID=A0AAQ3UEZ1_PASNO
MAKDQKPEDDKPRAGLHILLAEDTFVLQTIQRRMLNQLGATVKVAQNGVLAVNLFKEAPGRPVLQERGQQYPFPMSSSWIASLSDNPTIFLFDGYEATKMIREEERLHGIHTPIIALTAHVMQEDLEKAIHTGMDLQFTKPIKRNSIVEVVHSRHCSCY